MDGFISISKFTLTNIRITNKVPLATGEALLQFILTRIRDLDDLEAAQIYSQIASLQDFILDPARFSEITEEQRDKILPIIVEHSRLSPRSKQMFQNILAEFTRKYRFTCRKSP